MDGMDAFNQQALGILTSSKLADALDLSKEDPQDRSTATASTTRRSSATARRGWSATSASPAGWSRPAPAW